MRAGASTLPLRLATPEEDGGDAYVALVGAWRAYWRDSGSYPAPVCPCRTEEAFWRWMRAYDAAVARGCLDGLPMAEWRRVMLVEGVQARAVRVAG